MAKMTDSELLVVLNSFESDSTAYSDEFMSINEESLRRYNGELYGDEEEGRSKVIATDVADIVDSDMTSLVRVFLGSGDVMVFEPNTDSDEESEEAREKTKYVNYLVRGRPGSYKVVHDWMKDAEIQKMGVCHYFIDEEKKTRTVSYEGLTSPRIAELMKSIEEESDIVEKVIVSEQTEIKGGVAGFSAFDVTFTVTENKKKIKIINIPTEDFRISRNASSKWDANLVGHITYQTRGELVAQGMTFEKVSQLPSSSVGTTNNPSAQTNFQSASGSTMKSIRWTDEGGNTTTASPEWASEQVAILNSYVKVDFDQDGIPERRFIRKAGSVILDNEPYDHVPYGILSGILDPHKALGHGRASLVMQDAKVNTALQRGILDNIYKVNNPRTVVGEGVDLDDMLDVRLDGLVRVDGNADANVGNQVMPLVTPYIGDKALQVVQYRDSLKAQRAGQMMASQGLEADDLGKETATRFTGVDKAAKAKIELVARNFAETGFRELYDGVAWLATHYQDQKEEFRVLGTSLDVTPTDWKYEHSPVSQVGLGAGDGEQAVQNMSGILAIQQQLKQQGSMLTDEQKTYNALDRMVMGLGLARTDEFFNNPDIPAQMMMPQIEKLTMALQQSQQMIEQLTAKNPLAEAEMVKQQGVVANGQAKNETELIKAAEQGRLKDRELDLKELEMVQDGAQFEATLTKDYTEIELDNGVDIPGQGQ